MNAGKGGKRKRNRRKTDGLPAHGTPSKPQQPLMLTGYQLLTHNHMLYGENGGNTNLLYQLRPMRQILRADL